jgi:hypothetical protein
MCGNIKKLSIADCRFVILLFFINGFAFFVNSCSQNKREPTVDLRIEESKLLLNGVFVMPLDAITHRENYLIPLLNDVLIARKTTIKNYRDSLIRDLDVLLFEEKQKVSKNERNLALDSIRELPYAISLEVNQKITFDVFAKIYYTAFQAGLNRFMLSDSFSSSSRENRITFSSTACSPYATLTGAPKTEIQTIRPDAMAALPFFLPGDDAAERKLEKRQSKNNRRPVGSFQLTMQLSENGIDLFMEYIAATGDSLIGQKYWVCEAEQKFTLPNLGSRRDWSGLENMISIIASKLEANHLNLYCKRNLNILCKPKSDFDEFHTAVGVVQKAGSLTMPTWFNIITPGLYFKE